MLTPPFQVPDEDAHFYRAIEIADGRWIATKRGEFTGDDIPIAVKELVSRYATVRTGAEQKITPAEILDSAGIRDDGHSREFLPFSNTAIHSPLAYVPQAVGVALARLFTARVLVWFYAGRFVNLVIGVAIVALAIRLTPVGKWSFAVLALTPMALFEAASLSADAGTNAVSFLLIAQALALAMRQAPVNRCLPILYLSLTGAAIGLMKQAYFLLPLSYLLIPYRIIGGRRRWWTGLAVVLAATFIAVCGWASVVRHVYSPADPEKGMDPAAQVRFMAGHPLEFLFALGRTAKNWQLFEEEYYGYLGLLDTRMPAWLYLSAYVMLLLVFPGDYDPRKSLDRLQAALALFVAMVVGLSVLAIVHITWDKVAAPNIAIQGRYFIPIGPLVAVAIGRIGAFLPGFLRKRLLFAFAIAPVGLVIASEAMYDRYFVDSPNAAALRAYNEAMKLEMNRDNRERARRLFEQALSYDPDHVLSHLQLGQLLLRENPGEAENQFRTALRLEPHNIMALNNLANLLTRQLEFAQAVDLYREACQVSPGDENLRTNLNRAVRAQAQFENAKSQVTALFESLLGPNLVRKSDGKQQGELLYLRPNRGRVLDAAGRSPRLDPYFWRWPPPCGQDLPLFDLGGRPVAGPRQPFYACCGIPAGPKRAFLFPPAKVVLSADEDMSWYFQVPLADLNAAEREREQRYRQQLGLRFPLSTLPE